MAAPARRVFRRAQPVLRDVVAGREQRLERRAERRRENADDRDREPELAERDRHWKRRLRMCPIWMPRSKKTRNATAWIATASGPPSGKPMITFTRISTRSFGRQRLSTAPDEKKNIS